MVGVLFPMIMQVLFHHARFGELDDLAGIQTPVTRNHIGNHTDESKDVHIHTAEHLDAQDDGCDGAVGHTAEQAYQSQRRSKSCVKAQKAARR